MFPYRHEWIILMIGLVVDVKSLEETTNLTAEEVFQAIEKLMPHL